MGGKSTLRTRMKALDKIFSEWIRRKDATQHGIARCVTCGRCGHWTTMQAGHFWKRSHLATRWAPFNVNVQCARCNMYRGGAEAEHAAYIIREYGSEIFAQLEEAHARVKKWSRDEIESMITDYKAKVAQLES